MESARRYSEMHINPTVLKVLLPVTEYEELRRLQTGPDSVWTKQSIPAKHISLFNLQAIAQKGADMALKILKKAEAPAPTVKAEKPPDYVRILKGKKGAS